MKFEFYVLNYDTNKGKVVNFNIFRNIRVQESTEKAVKKYLRAPSKFSAEKKDYKLDTSEKIYGFPAFCEELRHIIMWQEWSRCEYEIMVGSLFEEDCRNLQKVDCYMQALPNIEIIAREVIYQYKKQTKENKENNCSIC